MQTVKIYRRPLRIGNTAIGYNYVFRDTLKELLVSEPYVTATSNTQSVAGEPALQTSAIIPLPFNEEFFYSDYASIDASDGRTLYYFITGVTYTKNLCTIHLQLDHITTYDLLNRAVTGTLSRITDTNPNITRIDYPLVASEILSFITAPLVTGAFVGSTATETAFIASIVDLENPVSAKSITTAGGSQNFLYATQTPNSTTYASTINGTTLTNNTDSSALFLSNTTTIEGVNQAVSVGANNAVDYAFQIPSDYITTTMATTNRVATITGNDISYNSQVPVTVSEVNLNNIAIEGGYVFTISSILTGESMSIPAVNLINTTGYVNVNVWCNPKATGRPYCRFSNVRWNTLVGNSNMNNFGFGMQLSVAGATWAKYNIATNAPHNSANADFDRRVTTEQLVFDYRIHQERLSNEQAIATMENNAQNVNTQLQHMLQAPAFIGNLGGGNLGGIGNQALTTGIRELEQRQINNAFQINNQFRARERELASIITERNKRNVKGNAQIMRVPDIIMHGTSNNEEFAGYSGSNGFWVTRITPSIQDLQVYDKYIDFFGYPTQQEYISQMLTSTGREAFVYYEFSTVMGVHGLETFGNTIVTDILLNGVRIWNIIPSDYTSNNLSS